IHDERGARERPEIACALASRHQVQRLEQMRQLVRDREVLEPARPHPDAGPLGIERAPAEHAAFLREPDANRRLFELGEETAHELRGVTNAIEVRRANDETRKAPAWAWGAEIELELLEWIARTATPRRAWALWLIGDRDRAHRPAFRLAPSLEGSHAHL